MNREALLQSPLPVNKVAARVIKSAKPENLWNPKPKKLTHFVESSEVLRTGPLPNGARPELLTLPGKRRGKMAIVGYAAQQGGGVGAKWVVRCDCGNYEHRKRIFRWLENAEPDSCRECRHRAYKLAGWVDT